MLTESEHIKLRLQAKVNLLKLSENQYPGRIVIVGLNEAANAMYQLVAITGRSASSRNRRYKAVASSRLVTEVADEAAMAGQDPTLQFGHRV